MRERECCRPHITRRSSVEAAILPRIVAFCVGSFVEEHHSTEAILTGSRQAMLPSQLAIRNWHSYWPKADLDTVSVRCGVKEPAEPQP